LIIDIFLLLVGLSVLCIFFGWKAEKPYLLVFGYVLMFVTGMNLFTGVEYYSGVTITTDGNSTVVTDNYTEYTNNTMGIMFSIIWGLMFVQTLLEFRPRRDA
jgi:hypothetical protein